MLRRFGLRCVTYFVAHGSLALQERQQMADIEWAVKSAQREPRIWL